MADAPKGVAGGSLAPAVGVAANQTGPRGLGIKDFRWNFYQLALTLDNGKELLSPDLRGADGRGIIDVDKVGNALRLTFNDNTIADFDLPKGDKGDPGPEGGRGAAGKDAPVYQSISNTTLNVGSGAAVGFSNIPALTAAARISIEGADIRVTTTGTAPTATVGDLLEAGTGWLIESAADVAAFKALAQAGGAAVLQVTYLKVVP